MGDPRGTRGGSLLTRTRPALGPAGKHAHTCMHEHVRTHTPSAATVHAHLHVPKDPARTPRPSGSACTPPTARRARTPVLSLAPTRRLSGLPRPSPQVHLRAGTAVCFAQLFVLCFLRCLLLHPMSPETGPWARGFTQLQRKRSWGGAVLPAAPPGPQWGSPQAEATPHPFSPSEPAECPLAGSLCLHLAPCGPLGPAAALGKSSGGPPFGVPSCSSAEGAQPHASFATWTPGSHAGHCVLWAPTPLATGLEGEWTSLFT